MTCPCPSTARDTPSPWPATGWMSWASSPTCGKSSPGPPSPSARSSRWRPAASPTPCLTRWATSSGPPRGPSSTPAISSWTPTPSMACARTSSAGGRRGERGVLCLLSDSTNSEVTQETGSERVVEHAFERLFREAQGRIVVALFASNLHRVRTVLKLAEQLGRRVALQGRSMTRNVEMARQLGYLDVPESLFIPLEAVPSLAPGRVVLLSTGAQGEARAGLAQLAAGKGPVRLGPGDMVVLSARPIPGNERSVGALLDQLQWTGARLVYAQVEPDIHVSGHASQPQQRRVLDLVRPQHFIPVHGEMRHLHRHLATARESGLTPEQLLLARDGDLISFEEGRGRFAGQVPTGRIHKDLYSGGVVTPEALQERTRLAETGMVVAVAVIDRASLALMAGPQLSGQGLSLDEQAMLPRVAEEARTLFLQLSPQLRGDDALVREELTRSVRRAFKLFTPKRPLVVPMVVKV
ncbi:metallo-beta-lactamase family protein [Stigmatella aurantiaca DW4/3-1]|uniref:Metallo-beta-lactamase family protein n=1 Tax=Stigmatella aurantiaca (strain DW4/3-1) TaxID=378806 RepID=Q09CS6_STIAD|nr:metallo-beta-lactamase family protein [Stigmatella aurantiaca DW4/3-1]